MSLRKLESVTSFADTPRRHTRFAQSSNVESCVTPRSSVIASNVVRPGDFRTLLGSLPSRCSTTSVERRKPLFLLTPATTLLSHFTRNLKFLYGSRRDGLTLNSATLAAP